MSFPKFMWNSFLIPPLVAMVALVAVQLVLFWGPVSWFLVTLWSYLWPVLSLGIFWGVVILWILVGFVGLVGSLSPKNNRKLRQEEAIGFACAGVGLSISLKFVLYYDGAVLLWPSSLSTVVIVCILIGSLIAHVCGCFISESLLAQAKKPKQNDKLVTAEPRQVITVEPEQVDSVEPRKDGNGLKLALKEIVVKP